MNAVASPGIEAHQPLVCRFVERISAQQLPCIPDGRDVVTARVETIRKVLESMEITPAKPVALGLDPLVVTSLEQIVAVERYRLLQSGSIGCVSLICPIQRIFERAHIKPVRSVRAPLQRPFSNVEKRSQFRNGMQQSVEQVTKVRARLRLAGIRPEEKGEALARLRSVPVQKEVGQQRPRAGRFERRQGRTAKSKIELTKEPYVQGRPIHPKVPPP